MANDRYFVVCDVLQGVPPDSSSCTVSYELRTDSQLLPPLTIAEGGVIATAVVGCWAVGWAFRQIMQHLSKS